VEVLDFAITGYGPNQYAAVVEKYAPLYQPDLIILEMFVNDFQDALTTNKEFQSGIGFGLPDSSSWLARLHLMHLHTFIQTFLAAPIAEWLTDKPNSLGYALGNFAALEKNRTDLKIAGVNVVADRLAQIKRAADRIGAPVVIVMVPASVQVCKPEQLDYYPRSIDLTDTTRYDLDQPQRAIQQLAQMLNIGYYDLRPLLKQLAVEQCPYVPYNMHWTADTHRAVAADVTVQLQRDRFIRGK
jgi:hypothetical protein